LLGTPMLGLGGLGAALGNLASQAVTGVFQVCMARRHARIGLYWRGVRFVVAGLAMAVVTGLIQQEMPDTVWMTAVALAVGGAVYLAVLAMLREFTRADAHLFLDLLRPGEMIRYMLGELRKPA